MKEYVYNTPNFTYREDVSHLVLTILVDENTNEVKDFNVDRWAYGEVVDNNIDIEDIGDSFECGLLRCLDHTDFDNNIFLWRYDGNKVIPGLYHIPTDTYIGIQGEYDSWNGTTYYGKVISKLKTVEVYRPCSIKHI